MILSDAIRKSLEEYLGKEAPGTHRASALEQIIIKLKKIRPGISPKPE
jgi:hypothetical protein